MINISEALKILGEFKRLSEILGPNGDEQRWQLLQEWLADHPRYRKKLYHCLSLTPADAVPYLCKELGLDYDGLSLLDPGGQMLAMAQRSIAQLQDLYRDRSVADVKALLNEAPKTQKKRKVNR
jgi:hypothetical protein